MYLERRSYVKNRSFTKPEEKTEITINGGSGEQAKIKPDNISYIIEEAGQWRKANAIHNWFVVNVQDGNDDCKEYPVSEEQLKNLLSLVNMVLEASKLVDGTVITGYTFKDGKKEEVLEKGKIIENSLVAESFLPTSSGFFYGSTEYNEYYIDDLKHTKEILEEALARGGEYYYWSSW